MQRYTVKAQVTVDVEIELDAASEEVAEKAFQHGIAMNATISDNKAAVTVDESISDVDGIVVERTY